MRKQSLLAVSAAVFLGSFLVGCGSSTADGSGDGNLTAGAAGLQSVAGSGMSAGGAPTGGAPAGGTAAGGASAGESGAAQGGSAGSAQAGSAGSAGAVQGGSGGAGGAQGGGAGQAGSGGMGGVGGVPSTGPRVVMYLDNYTPPKWAGWVPKMDFKKMTHLNLAFAISSPKNDWNFEESDEDVKAIVDAAHAAGVKVLASLGGGAGTGTVYKQYNTPSNDTALVANLDAFLTKYNLDGADIDIESTNNLGANYATFVSKVIATLRPKGKLVTAAVALFLKSGYTKETLQSFDFVSLMIYANNTNAYTTDSKWLIDAGMPKSKLVFGTGFHAADVDDNNEISYSTLLTMDPDAWEKVQFKFNNISYYLADVDMTKQITNMSKGYGGIMVWTYTEDVTGEHSLWKAIQDSL